MSRNSLLDVAGFLPPLLQSPSAWLGHLHFAAWVMREVSPKIFVELGTHYGHSYFSFCQSVVESGISTKCYAVDTWRGDEHAGQYSDEIFAEVSSHNQKHYAEFSQLLRMTFDDALTYFSDKSIGMLHIDGLHTYEAVRHDFETWLPKLSPGAIVILHDTNVRERDFGVWKFWDELQARYPDNLEFIHSYGLGILQINDVPENIRLEWLRPGSTEKQRLIKYFASLGSRESERFELNKLKRHVVSLNQAIEARDGQIADLNQAVEDRDSQVVNLNHRVAERDQQIISLNQSVMDRDGQVVNLNHRVAERDQQIISLNQSVVDRDRVIRGMLSSTSWQLTKPLRWCGSQVLRMKLLLKAIDLAHRHTGNPKGTLIKLLKVYKREGFLGIRSRVRFLLETNSFQNSASLSIRSAGNQQSVSKPSKEVVRHHQLVDIVICVHNAIDDVKRCLDSVVCNTYPPYQLIIVDDGSNQETKQYLEEFVIGQSVKLIRNDIATGYTKAANIGMRASRGEFVVLLNSDTIVPPKWLDRLVMCANSSEDIGIVGPLSNTASWQSVPAVMNERGDWAENPLPVEWSINRYANEVARVSPRIYPRVGFLNGFCLLIKRELIADIGLFDEETFARGYGEENDYSLRATDRGWRLAIADDCYVYHAQSRSYSNERRAVLAKLANESLVIKHGQGKIAHNLFLTQHHPALRYVRQRCVEIEKHALLRAEARNRFEGKRVLFLLPAKSAGGGGNIVLREAECMRELGVDAWIANLEIHQSFFEESHPDNQVPVIYLQTSSDLAKIAPDFDAVIATLYLTVYWMKPLQKIDKCLVLGYYVQDFEPNFFEKDGTNYRHAWESYTAIPDLRLFTKTKWNQQALSDELGVMASIVGPSLDIDGFHPSPLFATASGVIKILAMVRPATPRRAPETTMRVLQRLAEEFGSRIQIKIFGVAPDDSEFLTYPRDFLFQNLGEINSQGVAAALSDADIFIDCSLFQAMGLTAMEAMASGVAVVGPIDGGLKEIIKDGHNGILIDTKNENQIFDVVAQLIKDNELRAVIQNNAPEVLSHSPIFSSFRILDCLFSGSHQAPTPVLAEEKDSLCA